MTGDLVELARGRLAAAGGEVTPQQVAAVLRGEGRPVGDTTVLAVHEALCRDVLGAGPLEPLLRLEGVTDVLVSGPDDVWIDRGHGLEATSVSFADDAAVRRLAQRLAASGGRRLDESSPFVDVRLRDGTRLHAVLSPIARPGTCVSLRVPRARVFSLAELVESGFLAASGARLLSRVVAARLAFLISGGTGSGKTTLLSALLSLVDPAERLVLVEDASELRPDHPRAAALEARPPNVEGVGRIEVRELVRQALRMRPDRLVVGEVRGPEVVDLLAALNTGHRGGCGTIHANSASDVPTRVESLALAAGLPRLAVHAQFGAAVDLVLHVERGRDGLRRLAEVAVPSRRSDGVVDMLTAVDFAADGSVRAGPGAGLLDEKLPP